MRPVLTITSLRTVTIGLALSLSAATVHAGDFDIDLVQLQELSPAPGTIISADGLDQYKQVLDPDLAELIAGNVDLARISALARAFMAVRWDRWQSIQSEATPRGAWPDEAWMALRLACLPWELDDNRTIPVDDAIVRRLIAGDGAAAVDIALRRLRAAGLRPPLQGACADPVTARLWAAALAFPISFTCARAMARHFESNSQKENR